MSEPAVRRRTGGRSARVREAVLKATLHAVAEHGADAVSISEIARQAEVHETSIYRRWPTKEHLVLDALLDYSEAKLPIPDTGTLRDDLVAFATEVTAYLDSPARADAGQVDGRRRRRRHPGRRTRPVLEVAARPRQRDDRPRQGSRRGPDRPRRRPWPSNSSSHRCTSGRCSPASPSTSTLPFRLSTSSSRD